MRLLTIAALLALAALRADTPRAPRWVLEQAIRTLPVRQWRPPVAFQFERYNPVLLDHYRGLVCSEVRGLHDNDCGNSR